MKKLFLLQKSLFIAFAAATCGLFSIIGCAVQKPAAGRQGEAAGGEIRHAQASKALEEGRFVIEANEFLPPGGQIPGQVIHGQLHIHGGQTGRYQFHPRPLSENTARQPDHNGRHGGNNAGKAEKERRHTVLHENDRPANSQDRKVKITLYKDTDKCHVQVSNELLAYPVVKFTGVVRPAGE